jgi:hypothetical protein
MSTTPRRRFAAIAAVASLLAMVLTASATGTPNEESQGRHLAESLRSGETRCADLSAADFELIGEYAMGRYLGNPQVHAAMNRRMTAMTGAAGERRMHIALGHHYSGCAGGPASGWVGPMGSMMSGRSGGNIGPGMMGRGEYENRGSRQSTMMDFRGHGDSDISAMAVVLIALGAAALGGGLVALLRGRRPPAQGATP